MTEPKHIYIDLHDKAFKLIGDVWVELVPCTIPGVERPTNNKESGMKFTSIWFRWVRGYPMPLREKIERTKDLWSMCMADWLPKLASYWIALRQIGKATMTSQNVPATSLDNVLENLGNVRDGKPLEQYKWTEKKAKIS